MLKPPPVCPVCGHKMKILAPVAGGFQFYCPQDSFGPGGVGTVERTVEGEPLVRYELPHRYWKEGVA